MLVYGMSADDAFTLLKQQSQQHNVKLRVLSPAIVGNLVELSKAKPTLDRLDIHSVIATAHERVTDVAAKRANDHV